MRDVARNLLHSRHQAFDLVEHRVQGQSQPVKFVVRALNRHAPRHIARHDGAAGLGDGIDAPEKVPAHQQAAAQSQHQGYGQRIENRRADDAGELAQRRDVAADNQFEFVLQIGMECADDVALGAGAPLYLKGKLDPVGFVVGKFRHGGEIAGDAPACGIGKQIDRAAVVGAAAPDGVDDAAQPADAVLVGQGLDFGADGVVGLTLEQDGGVPVDIAQQGRHRDGKQNQIERREAEGGSS